MASGSSLGTPSHSYLHRIAPSSFLPTGSTRYPSPPIASEPNYHPPPPLSATGSPDVIGYALPPLAPREATQLRSSWGEGEAGPSSLLLPGQRAPGTLRGRRGSSQPARRGPLSSPFTRIDRFDSEQESFFSGGSVGDGGGTGSSENLDQGEGRRLWHPLGRSVHGAFKCFSS